MKKTIGIVLGIIAVVLVTAFLIPPLAKGLRAVYAWGFNDTPIVATKNGNAEPAVSAVAVAIAGSSCDDCNKEVKTSVSTEPSCEVKLARMGAPDGTITAICSGSYGTVSQRLTSGTFVPIGSLTFDNEYRVWFLTNWKVPATANYSFSYENAEKNFFDAPFVIGSELGYAKDGTRVPFKICWETESKDCKIPKGVKID